MERYIGMDVHAASCTLAVISEKGRVILQGAEAPAAPLHTGGIGLGMSGVDEEISSPIAA